MSALHRSLATLRLSGDDLNPVEITKLLGCEPTRQQSKGELTESRHGWAPRIAGYGAWRLEATVTEPANIDAQVAELLGKVSAEMSVWHDLTERFHVNIFCGWFMKEGNEGIDLSPDTLLALGSRRLPLALDIYGADDET